MQTLVAPVCGSVKQFYGSKGNQRVGDDGHRVSVRQFGVAVLVVRVDVPCVPLVGQVVVQSQQVAALAGR